MLFEIYWFRYEDCISVTNTINCLMYYWQIEAELLKMEFLYFQLPDHFTTVPNVQDEIMKLTLQSFFWEGVKKRPILKDV